jgi:glycosyltransferase involved in cell wall biosynthesis
MAQVEIYPEPGAQPENPCKNKHEQSDPAEAGARPALVETDLADCTILAIIPAYNEERFIGSVVLKTRLFADTVIVVDDGSIDGTAEMAAAAGAKVLRHRQNQGKSAALNTAFQAARDYAPDVVVTLDADGQHLPEELAGVVAPVLRGEADVVIGSRYLEHTSQVPLHRIWGHRFFNWLTRAASGVRASDSQSGYRAFSRRALSNINFHSQGFSVECEMQFIAGEQALRVAEVPITIRYSDQPKRPAIQQGLQVLNGVLKLTGQYRPLFFFGLPGLVFFLGGLGWGAVIVDCYTRTHQLAVGHALVCVLLSVVGLIMTSTAFTLHSIRGLLTDLLKTHRRD